MRNHYLALQEERTALIAEGRALFDAADAEGRDLTEEERGEDDRISARLGEVNAELARWERQHQREAEAPASRIVAVGGNTEPDFATMSAEERIKYGLQQADKARA